MTEKVAGVTGSADIAAGGVMGVAFAALALLFTKRYPAGLYDFVLGLDRLRVADWAALESRVKTVTSGTVSVPAPNRPPARRVISRGLDL